MRYDFAPIDTHRGDTPLRVIAEKIGVPTPTVESWRRGGLSAENADLCATAIGFHPWQLWTEMLVAETEKVQRECANPACYEVFVPVRSDQRVCSPRCRKPAWRAANPERESELRKAEHARNRDRRNAERRQRYQHNRRGELLKQRQRDRVRRGPTRAERLSGAA